MRRRSRSRRCLRRRWRARRPTPRRSKRRHRPPLRYRPPSLRLPDRLRRHHRPQSPHCPRRCRQALRLPVRHRRMLRWLHWYWIVPSVPSLRMRLYPPRQRPACHRVVHLSSAPPIPDPFQHLILMLWLGPSRPRRRDRPAAHLPHLARHPRWTAACRRAVAHRRWRVRRTFARPRTRRSPPRPGRRLHWIDAGGPGRRAAPTPARRWRVLLVRRRHPRRPPVRRPGRRRPGGPGIARTRRRARERCVAPRRDRWRARWRRRESSAIRRRAPDSCCSG